MGLQNNESRGKTGGNISRRELLQGSAAFTVFSALRPLRGAAMVGPSGKLLVYAGTYSTAVDGGGGNGKGIYLFEMNPASGELNLVKLAAEARNASWLALDPSGRHLYAGNEIADFGGKSGTVSAYAVNRSDGNLQLLNVVSSEGSRPGPSKCRRNRKICVCRQLRRRDHSRAANPAHRSARPSYIRSPGHRVRRTEDPIEWPSRKFCFQRS